MSEMRTLYVITAGEADKTAPVMNELKRPLSSKGITQVLNLLEKMKEKPFLLPDLILCPPTLYVRQTLDLLHEVVRDIPVVCKDALYSAPDYRILDTIQSLDDILFNVMLMAELPGVNQFVNYITKGSKPIQLKPAQGLLITTDATLSWHKLGRQKARRRSFL